MIQEFKRGTLTSLIIKAGTVFVNTYGGSDNTLPLTGVKQSGNGSDKSLHALDKFTDLKSVWMKI